MHETRASRGDETRGYLYLMALARASGLRSCALPLVEARARKAKKLRTCSGAVDNKLKRGRYEVVGCGIVWVGDAEADPLPRHIVPRRGGSAVDPV